MAGAAAVARRHVLFVCTGNSARSILAEALTNAIGGERLQGHSAGSHPKGAVHPLALETLAALGIATAGLRSKSWDEFGAGREPAMDFVFTVCDQAAGEVCPFWPGQPVTAHWGMPDPAACGGSPDEQRRAFRATALVLKRRIELLLALPLARLDGLALQRRVDDIGRQ